MTGPGNQHRPVRAILHASEVMQFI